MAQYSGLLSSCVLFICWLVFATYISYIELHVYLFLNYICFFQFVIRWCRLCTSHSVLTTWWYMDGLQMNRPSFRYIVCTISTNNTVPPHPVGRRTLIRRCNMAWYLHLAHRPEVSTRKRSLEGAGQHRKRWWRPPIRQRLPSTPQAAGFTSMEAYLWTLTVRVCSLICHC